MPEFSKLNPNRKHGFWGRIKRLLAGSIGSTGLPRWPNGTKKEVKIKPVRFFLRNLTVRSFTRILKLFVHLVMKIS